jgi:hypothetical protein
MRQIFNYYLSMMITSCLAKEKRMIKSNNYDSSEKRALKKGYREVQDNKARNGQYFIKKDKKWIHNIPRYKLHLGMQNKI